jgi:hypothetical protein
MKVTPDSEVPIMPKATSSQGLRRLPMKKLSLSAAPPRRAAQRATPNSSRK